MDTLIDPTTDTAIDLVGVGNDAVADQEVAIPQYSRKAIVAIWAAAAIPMALLAWVVTPVLASSLTGAHALTRALIIALTIGMVWQFVLVVGLVAFEQRTLRWTTVREVLWLRSPTSPRTGRRGGKVWLIVLPLIVAVGAKEILPSLPRPAGQGPGTVLRVRRRPSVHARRVGGRFALMLVMFFFNTVMGEELLFRGFLLPRMQGAFGDRDWVANGVLFAGYHLHVPWVIPVTLLDMFVLAYPAKRYRSALVSISVHSAQSLVFALGALALVLA